MPTDLYPVWERLKINRHSPDYLEFSYYLEANLASLATELDNGTYHHGPYRVRRVTDKKSRILHIALPRDRLIHRYLYDILVSRLDHRFDPDVYSARVNKGLDRALLRAQFLLSKYPDAHIFRSDVAKFFDHVDHQLLLRLLSYHLEPNLLNLAREIINSFQTSPGRGLPLGNLTSQIFANLYLHEFDFYLRHQLKPLAYLRYGDDFMFFFSTRRTTQNAAAETIYFLENTLKLTLNARNTAIFSSSSPAYFLGHHITPVSITTDPHTCARLCPKVNFRNLPCYKALRLPSRLRCRLPYLAIENDPTLSQILTFYPYRP